MSVISTGPGKGIFAKGLDDVLGIGAQIAAGTGAFIRRLGPAVRRVTANPNGAVSDFGGSLALDPQNGAVYVNTSVGDVEGLNWAALGTSSIAALKMGNTIVVDQINGNDATGAVNGLPFATVNAAMTYMATLVLPAGGVTCWILPGTYALTAGITIPATCAMRGMSTQTTRISWAASVPGGTATLLTMSDNTRLEDLTLNLTSANATTNLVGVALPGTSADTAKLRTMVLNVNNAGVATGSTTNVYGILDSGTGPLLPYDFALNFTRGCTFNVYSNGGGNKRAILVNGDNTLSLRDTNFYVAAPTDPLSTGSYVGAECNNNLGQAAFRSCSISGPSTAGGYTGSDVLQTLPVARDTYGISIGPGTDLIHRTTGGKPFALTTTPTILAFSINATLSSAPRYLWPGVLPSGGDTDQVFFRFARIVLIQGMSVNMRIPPGAGNNVVFTVYRSATGLGGSGVATTMTITVSGLATTGVNLTAAVTINAGEYIALRADRSASGAADIAVQLDLY